MHPGRGCAAWRPPVPCSSQRSWRDPSRLCGKQASWGHRVRDLMQPCVLKDGSWWQGVPSRGPPTPLAVPSASLGTLDPFPGPCLVPAAAEPGYSSLGG